MISIFKRDNDGTWENESGRYFAKTIYKKERQKYLDDGWFLKLEDAQKDEVKDADNKGKHSKSGATRNNKD